MSTSDRRVVLGNHEIPAANRRDEPLRETEIAKCKVQRGSDPDCCGRFWSDYGNAVRRTNGAMSGRTTARQFSAYA